MNIRVPSVAAALEGLVIEFAKLARGQVNVHRVHIMVALHYIRELENELGVDHPKVVNWRNTLNPNDPLLRPLLHPDEQPSPYARNNP